MEKEKDTFGNKLNTSLQKIDEFEKVVKGNLITKEYEKMNYEECILDQTMWSKKS